jgi:methyl-accepting chemotaxis protein
MATNPINDPIRHLTAMVAQQVRHSQVLAGHVDRMANAISDLSKDMRSGFRSVNDRSEALRSEMNDRFKAVGARFDEIEERMIRVEDGMKDIRSDLLRIQNEILNAQQSALQAHLRLDDLSEGGEEPPP